MHCLSRVRALKSYTGGQKNDGFYQNRNSTASLGHSNKFIELCKSNNEIIHLIHNKQLRYLSGSK
jgi:hypothetical protein